MAEHDPAALRADLLATSEAMLDLYYEAHALLGLDLIDTLIVMCVAQAELRQRSGLGRGQAAARPVISRRLIAERIAIPRESVRRRIRSLAAAGVIAVTDRGQVVGLSLVDERFQRLASSGARVLKRYAIAR
jgi:CRP-like cAMP-binding protein